MQVPHSYISITTTTEAYFRIWTNCQCITGWCIWSKFILYSWLRGCKIPYCKSTSFTANNESSTIRQETTRSDVVISLGNKTKQNKIRENSKGVCNKTKQQLIKFKNTTEYQIHKSLPTTGKPLIKGTWFLLQLTTWLVPRAYWLDMFSITPLLLNLH